LSRKAQERSCLEGKMRKEAAASCVVGCQVVGECDDPCLSQETPPKHASATGQHNCHSHIVSSISQYEGRPAPAAPGLTACLQPSLCPRWQLPARRHLQQLRICDADVRKQRVAVGQVLQEQREGICEN
jgi:hypothetical protein